MITRLRNEAFTVVETMIVLAVTGFLLVGATTLIAGQQRKTEFYQSIRDIESKIQDFANDTATGFYPNNSDFSCDSDGVSPDPDINYSGSSAQGTNDGCIYLGRVIQLAPQNGNKNDVFAYTVVGSRVTPSPSGPVLSANANQTNPTALANTSSLDVAKYAEKETLKYGLEAKKMTIGNITTGTQIGAFGFVSMNPLSGATSGGQNVGLFNVDLVPITGTQVGTSTALDVVNSINSISNSTSVNPAGGIELCLETGATNQYAIIKIGGAGSKINVSTTINNGRCPT